MAAGPRVARTAKLISIVIALRLRVVLALELGLRHFRRQDHVGRVLDVVAGAPGRSLVTVTASDRTAVLGQAGPPSTTIMTGSPESRDARRSAGSRTAPAGVPEGRETCKRRIRFRSKRVVYRWPGGL